MKINITHQAALARITALEAQCANLRDELCMKKALTADSHELRECLEGVWRVPEFHSLISWTFCCRVKLALERSAEAYAGKCVVDADQLKEIQFALQCVVDNLVTTTNGAFTTAAFDDTEVTLIRDAAMAANKGKS